MNKSIAVIIIVLFSLSTLSQSITIKGTAIGQADKLIRVIVFADQFSNLEQTIAQTQTDSTGAFSLELEIEQTKFAYLALGLEKGEFYLSPSASYNFNVLIDTVVGKGSIFDRLPLNFTLKAFDNGIQQNIEDFNIDYNDFIYNNIKTIYKSRDKSVVVQFVKDMHDKYTVDKLEYVSNYVDYSLAQLLWLSRKENDQRILEKYFINRPVLYNNIQYTDFFKEFFKGYFNAEKTYSYEELILAINNRESIKALDAILDRDEKLALDNRVREIIEMLLMARNYHNRDVIKESVISKLNEIEKGSDYVENRLVAQNYIVKLQELQNSSPAPGFNLIAANDNQVSLDDYNDKFVLLSFVKDECNICDFHMQLLSDIQKQNGYKFEIVTIVAGDNIEKVVGFAQQRGFDWPILKTGDNILLLEDYKIRAFPSYVFINPDGTIAYMHLPMPDENMELYLQRFMDRYNGE